MEILIALILVMIMIVLDTKAPEQFTNYLKTIKIGKPNNIKPKLIRNKLIPSHIKSDSNYVCESMFSKVDVWIYNDYNVSSRFWKDFGSRRSVQETYGIIQLCIKSIHKHLNSTDYNIHVFNQTDILKLLPEYKELFSKCNNDYVVYNLIKYGILNKYGGLWIPKDTLMLNSIFSSNDFATGNVVTYGKHNKNIDDYFGYSDLIIGTSANNSIINNVFSYIKLNLNTFQNGMLFKNSISKFFNKSIANNNYHVHKDLLITNISDNEDLSISHLFSTSFINIKDFSLKTFININAENINNSVKYSYLLSMSSEQIMNSNLFIAYLVKIALQ